MTNGQILGNQKNLRHFGEAAYAGKLSHAYIISGPKGSGKKTFAEYVARGLLCEQNVPGGCSSAEQPTERYAGLHPCGVCDRCVKTQTGNHPDLIHVTHKKENLISVGEIRTQVVEDIAIKPYYGPYKIYLIPDASLMNVNAQNALLKTIEEPPAYGILFLLTDNVDGLLETVRSRCLTMDMELLPKETIVRYLQSHQEADRQAAEDAALFARGNLGLAIDLAEGGDAGQQRETIADFLKNLVWADAVELLDYAQQIEAMKALPCLGLVRTWFRDVLLVKAANRKDDLYFRKEHITIENQAQRLSLEQLDQIFQMITETETELAANVKAEAASYALLVKIRDVLR